MNGLFVNCALAASTVAASALVVETRLKKFDEMIAKEGARLNRAAEEAIGAEKKNLETYDATMRAAAGAIHSRQRAEAAEAKARVFIAERDKKLTARMDAKFEELEAKLRAGDLEAACARSDALATEMNADKKMKAVKARDAVAASDGSDEE